MIKIVKNEIIKKFLIVFLVIIMVSNFIIPNTVHAGLEEIANGFFYLLAKLGDVIIKILQRMMVGTTQIINGVGENAHYAIRYSSGMIFANKIPALDVNFFNPMNGGTGIGEDNPLDLGYLLDNYFNPQVITVNNPVTDSHDDMITAYYEVVSANGTEVYTEQEGNSWFRFGEDKYEIWENYIIQRAYNRLKERSDADAEIAYIQNTGGGYISDDWYRGELWASILMNVKTGQMWCVSAVYSDFIFGRLFNVSVFEKYLTANDYNIIVNEDNKNDYIGVTESTAGRLKNEISTWYNNLYIVSLVGLLSVLVYLGIRIILSSASAQNKAKYKTIIKDWIVAICLLFVLHYMMTFMMSMIGWLNNIITDNVVNSNSSGHRFFI